MARFVEIWLDHSEILTRSYRISSNIVRSDEISSNLCRRTPNTASFCKFSSKILRISLEVFDFIHRLGGSSFGGGNLPTDPKVLSSMGGDPQEEAFEVFNLKSVIWKLRLRNL